MVLQDYPKNPGLQTDDVARVFFLYHIERKDIWLSNGYVFLYYNRLILFSPN